MMGSVTLDLRAATFAERDITITANAIMGEVTIIVDAGTHVVVSGVPIMGEFHQAKDKVARPARPPTLPWCAIKGFALMASVSVQRQPAARHAEEARGTCDCGEPAGDGTPARAGVPTVVVVATVTNGEERRQVSPRRDRGTR